MIPATPTTTGTTGNSDEGSGDAGTTVVTVVTGLVVTGCWLPVVVGVICVGVGEGVKGTVTVDDPVTVPVPPAPTVTDAGPPTVPEPLSPSTNVPLKIEAPDAAGAVTV